MIVCPLCNSGLLMTAHEKGILQCQSSKCLCYFLVQFMDGNFSQFQKDVCEDDFFYEEKETPHVKLLLMDSGESGTLYYSGKEFESKFIDN